MDRRFPLLKCLLAVGLTGSTATLAQNLEVPGVPGTEVPGTEVPGTEVPGTEVPGTEVPGTEVPGTEVPEPPSAPRVSIEPEFVLGHTYRYVSELDFRARLPDLGVRSLSVEQQARFEVEPRDGDKEGLSVIGRTEHLAVSIRASREALEYDSFESDDRKSKFGRHLQTGLLERVKVTLNREGRVVSDEVEGGAFGAEKQSDLPRFGSRELVDLVSLLLQGGSEGQVRLGGTWSLEGRRPIGEVGELEFDLRFRRTGPIEYQGHACERITVVGTIGGELPAGSPEAGENPDPGKIMGLEQGRLEGELYYDATLRTYRFLEQSITVGLRSPAAGEAERVLPQGRGDETGAGETGNAVREILLQQRHTVRLLHRVPTP